MKFQLYFIPLVILIVALATTSFSATPMWMPIMLCIAIFIVLILLYRCVAIPLQATRNGMYLLREQDFSSRLRPTGQPDADIIVDLYNTLISSMKAERLKNLEQNRFLTLVIEASPLGIAICDFDGKIIETNRAWQVMLTPDLEKAIDETEIGVTRTVRLADALIFRISRLWFMDSGFRRYFILVERLTDEIAAAEKQMFNKIVRTIGHEVNNTLGSVMSVLDSLEELHSDDDLISDAITSSRTSCNNLVSFVRGYADIVKLPPVAPELTDMNSWLGQLRPFLLGMCPANISLQFEPCIDECKANLDTMLMERVIVNIVKNSIESIGDKPDGRIDIVLQPKRLAIIDNGKGISKEVADKLFTPFFSTKRPDRGLGLMLIADILRAHNFAFSLSTSGSTTFSISLRNEHETSHLAL